MKRAIIDPRETVYQITGHTTKGVPIQQPIPNSARVAEVTDTEFPVAEPLFWVDCADEVVADQWYYDMVQQACIILPTAPQPDVTGAQTL